MKTRQKKVFDQHHTNKKRQKQLQTRGEKDKGVSLSFSNVSLYFTIYLSCTQSLDLTVTVRHLGVLLVCRFRAPFFSKVV